MAGELSVERQEFYVITQVDLNGVYAYLRTIDGGDNWAFDYVYLGDNPNQQITGPFGAQIVVQDAGKVYLTCFDPDSEYILMYERTDRDPADPNNYDPTDPADVGVRWVAAIGTVGIDGFDGPPVQAPLRMPIHRASFSNPDVLPGNVVGQMVPQLAIDPTDPDRMYLVYYDTVAASGDGSTDVDVYLRTLDRHSTSWFASGRIRVNNDDDPEEEHDQCIPSVMVDSEGFVNITFYDDRDFTQDDTASLGKYNMYFAWCPPNEIDFSASERNIKLEADPDFPALDQTIYNVDPHEYNGICWYGDDVLCVYTGTDPNDPQSTDSVIGANRVVWTDAP